MVNLEDWVDQEVLVTYSNGATGSSKVTKLDQWYMVEDLTYNVAGNRHPAWATPNDIIKIQPMNKKEQLKQQIKALEAELKNLEASDKVPEGFDEELAYEFLYGNGYGDLGASHWGPNTQEGKDYWFEISVRDREPTDKDIIQLQKWIIESYRRKLGLDP